MPNPINHGPLWTKARGHCYKILKIFFPWPPSSEHFSLWKAEAPTYNYSHCTDWKADKNCDVYTGWKNRNVNTPPSSQSSQNFLARSQGFSKHTLWSNKSILKSGLPFPGPHLGEPSRTQAPVCTCIASPSVCKPSTFQLPASAEVGAPLTTLKNTQLSGRDLPAKDGVAKTGAREEGGQDIPKVHDSISRKTLPGQVGIQERECVYVKGLGATPNLISRWPLLPGKPGCF